MQGHVNYTRRHRIDVRRGNRNALVTDDSADTTRGADAFASSRFEEGRREDVPPNARYMRYVRLSPWHARMRNVFWNRYSQWRTEVDHRMVVGD